MQGGMIMGTPTRVVLLRNMVGPGQVDEDLEDEVANECSKYGQVQSVMIFEVTTPGYPDDQAVRIFVEFERMEQATKVCMAASVMCSVVCVAQAFGCCCLEWCLPWHHLWWLSSLKSFFVCDLASITYIGQIRAL